MQNVAADCTVRTNDVVADLKITRLTPCSLESGTVPGMQSLTVQAIGSKVAMLKIR